MPRSKKQRLHYLIKKIAKIEADFPNVDFRNYAITQARNKHHELVKEMIYLKVDINFCESEDRHKMCSDCDCWKLAAANHNK